MRDVFLPGSLDALWSDLERAPGAVVYAGGTDLLVKMRSGLTNPQSLICLERIEELKGIREEDDELRIGSCSTHSQILSDFLAQRHLSVLLSALKVLGSPLIRNMGTIGGNICTASPAGDTLPPLYALGAEVELRSRNVLRRMPLDDFMQSPGHTRLQKGEILTAVYIRKPEAYNLHHFEKVGRRNALACSIVSLAALLRLSEKGVVEEASFAWGSVGPTVLKCPEAEAALKGEKLHFDKLEEAAALVREAVIPITDIRADLDYRRTVAGNLLLRLAQ